MADRKKKRRLLGKTGLTSMMNVDAVNQSAMSQKIAVMSSMSVAGIT